MKKRISASFKAEYLKVFILTLFWGMLIFIFYKAGFPSIFFIILLLCGLPILSRLLTLINKKHVDIKAGQLCISDGEQEIIVPLYKIASLHFHSTIFLTGLSEIELVLEDRTVFEDRVFFIPKTSLFDMENGMLSFRRLRKAVEQAKLEKTGY